MHGRHQGVQLLVAAVVRIVHLARHDGRAEEAQCSHGERHRQEDTCHTNVLLTVAELIDNLNWTKLKCFIHD